MQCDGMGQATVINCPQWFADPAFMAWLNDPETVVFTWHRKGRSATEFSDVVVLLEPDLGGEGSNTEMPHWEELVAYCRETLVKPRQGQHLTVRLTNLQS